MRVFLTSNYTDKFQSQNPIFFLEIKNLFSMILFTLDLLVKAASNLTLREDWCTTFCIVILAYTCVPNMARKTKNPEKEFTMNQYTEVTKHTTVYIYTYKCHQKNWCYKLSRNTFKHQSKISLLLIILLISCSSCFIKHHLQLQIHKLSSHFFYQVH